MYRSNKRSSPSVSVSASCSPSGLESPSESVSPSGIPSYSEEAGLDLGTFTAEGNWIVSACITITSPDLYNPSIECVAIIDITYVSAAYGYRTCRCSIKDGKFCFDKRDKVEFINSREMLDKITAVIADPNRSSNTVD